MAIKKAVREMSEKSGPSANQARDLKPFKTDSLPYESEIVQEFVRRIYTVYTPRHIVAPPDLILQAFEKASSQGTPITGVDDLIDKVFLFSRTKISKAQVAYAIKFIRKKATLYSEKFNTPQIADIVKGQIVYDLECKKDAPVKTAQEQAQPTEAERKALKPYLVFFELLEERLAKVGDNGLSMEVVKAHLMALERGVLITSIEELVRKLASGDYSQRQIRKARTKLNMHVINLYRSMESEGEEPYYFNRDVCLDENTRNMKPEKTTEIQRKRTNWANGLPISMAVKNEEKLTMEQAIETANSMKIVIASHKTIHEIYNNPRTGKAMVSALRDAWPYWTGTMVAYESKGVKLGSTIEFMEHGSQIRYIFPTGDYKGEKNVVLAVNHPNFHIEKDGNNRIIHARNIGIVRNFPHVSGWYLLDDEFGLPYGKELHETSKGEAIGISKTKMVSLTTHSTTAGVLSFPIQCLYPLGRGGGLVKDDTKEWKPYDRM